MTKKVAQMMIFDFDRTESIREKEKMLVTSIFSFSHNVFKRSLLQGCEKLGLCGKELILSQTSTEDYVSAVEVL